MRGLLKSPKRRVLPAPGCPLRQSTSNIGLLLAVALVMVLQATVSPGEARTCSDSCSSSWCRSPAAKQRACLHC